MSDMTSITFKKNTHCEMNQNEAIIIIKNVVRGLNVSLPGKTFWTVEGIAVTLLVCKYCLRTCKGSAYEYMIQTQKLKQIRGGQVQ